MSSIDSLYLTIQQVLSGISSGSRLSVLSQQVHRPITPMTDENTAATNLHLTDWERIFGVGIN